MEENQEESMSFEELYENSLKEVKLDKIVTGKVIRITKQGEIFVDLGYKADGIIPKAEYSFEEDADPNEEFKPGDTITADILKMNDGYGNVLLSYKKAKSRNAKKDFLKKVEGQEVFQEKVTEVITKGLIVNKAGIRIFIPLSLAGIGKEENIEDYKGKIITFKIIEYDEKARRIIGSVKAVTEEAKEQEAKTFWEEAEVGKEYEGTVNSLSTYGAFVEIGPIQGLLHLSEMSWSKNANPQEILSVGQKIKVKIKALDKENKRIQLSYEEKGPDPWEDVEQKYRINDIVKVKVVKIMPFGVFVELEKGVEGLVHISQICERRIAKPDEVLQIGTIVNAKIIDMRKEEKKLELSIKELEGTSRRI